MLFLKINHYIWKVITFLRSTFVGLVKMIFKFYVKRIKHEINKNRIFDDINCFTTLYGS